MFKKCIFVIFYILFSVQPAFSDNFMEKKIRRISKRKKSVYLASGIFHNGGPKVSSSLKGIRQNFSGGKGYERLVFDFKTDQLPRIYGYVAGEQRKLYIDFFETKMTANVASFGNSKYVKSINFFPIQSDILSAEVVFKDKVALDIFSLSSPGRLVIDLKK